MNETKAIIFDLGKVVFALSFDRIFQFWANASGKEFDDLKNKFQFDITFEKLEKDEISSTQFRHEISKRLDLEINDQEFDKGWCDLYLETYTGIDDLLAALQKNYKLVALTNTNIIHHKVWKIKYAHTLAYFQKIFSSYEIRERKPDQKAFQIVLDYLHVAPHKTVFPDDNIEKINTAKKLGLKTILVTSFEQMTNDLHEIGITH